MATRLDTVEPLELPSIRDEIARAPSVVDAGDGDDAARDRRGRARGARAGDAPTTPARADPRGGARRRVVPRALFVVARRRPDEPLAVLMACGAVVGAVALLGAALVARRRRRRLRDWAVACARSPSRSSRRSACTSRSACPTASCVTTPRRVATGVAYAVSVGLAALLVDRRPDVSVTPIAIVVGVGAARGCRRIPRAVPARAELRTNARGCSGSRGPWSSRPRSRSSRSCSTRSSTGRTPCAASRSTHDRLVPLALALGASERIAVRIDRLLVHTITLAGLAAMVAACYLLIVLGLGREPTGDEQTLLGLSMLAAAVAALLWLPVRERLTDVATRRVVRRAARARRGAAHVREPAHARAAARRAAAPAGGVAEEDDAALGRRGVDARAPSGLERAVSVPERGPGRIAVGTERRRP